jgi:hypothetical protein
MKKFQNILLSGILLLLIISSCKKQESKTNNNTEENELITTLAIHFTDTATGDTFSYAWRQPAGVGTAITVDTIRLKAGKSYLAQVQVLDESKKPAVDITSEIAELANEHRFFYSTINSALQISILDFDTQNPPMELGLKFRLNSLSANPWLGAFGVKLKHYPSSSPKTGGEANGTTDIEVSFPMKLE